MTGEAAAVLVEVGLNELATKAQNPNVPYVCAEVAESAADAVHAGAAIVHFHARDADGQQEWSNAESYRVTCEEIAANVDALVYPSYFNDDFTHVYELAKPDGNGWRLDLAPFDPMQSVRFALWDEASEQMVAFETDGAMAAVPPYPPVLDHFRSLDLVPNFGIFNSSDLRWAVNAARAGLVKSPVNLKLFFSDSLLTANAPTPSMLDLLLKQIPTSIDFEVIVVPYMMADAGLCDVLWNAAFDRGLGVRVGIGDCPAAFPSATNADLVRHVVELMRVRGLEPASVDAARQRMGVANDARKTRTAGAT